MGSADPREFLRRALSLGEGKAPYPWQVNLLGQMVKGIVPELIDIPTGLGKTAIIAIWAVARRCGASLPRRLVYCLPMRVLVEQTRARAIQWLRNVDLLAGQADFQDNRLTFYQAAWDSPDKIAVVTLMGGEVADEWVAHPERAAVIVGTQDMLLSRALNRGYATAPQRWPVDFGFLNVDTLWVLDEVQLMGPGRTTSVQLQHFWDQGPPSYGVRRTIWMSATLGTRPGSTDQPSWMQTPERKGGQLTGAALRSSGADISHPDFAARWTAPKQLELRIDSVPAHSAAAGQRKGRSRASLSRPRGSGASCTIESNELVHRIVNEAANGRLVLVFVNQVERARQFTDRVRQQGGSGPEVLLLHGQMRPRDRKDTVAKLDSLIPPAGRVVVATQVLEAGMDVDADTLVTELCPWPSLVQRLGRLNRSGTRPSSQDVQSGRRQPAVAIVLELPMPPPKKGESKKDYKERSQREAAAPYKRESLEEARCRLDAIAAKYNRSLSPETLASFPVELEVEGPVLRRFDLDDLFDTDPDLSGGHTDVSAFIRAVDRDVDAYLLWRRIVGGLGADEQVPIHPDELCPVPFYRARDVFRDRDVWILTLATGRKRGSAWRRARGQDIQPGDTVMVDVTAGSYREDTGWTGDPKDRPTCVVDRWDGDNGSQVRAWVRLDGKTRSLVEEIDGHVVGPRARGEDPRSFSKQWLELRPHLDRAKQEANQLATALGLPGQLTNSVVSAAYWHDVGKALERNANGKVCQPFQRMLRRAGVLEDGHPRAATLYAKSNRPGGGPTGFRHELASLLAFLLANQGDDLAAFLIVAHHGKVRLLPEAWDDEDPSDLCGVRAGDRIPAVALPARVHGPVDLDPRILLPSRSRPGWQGRVHRILQQHGPFLLAYLEGLVRVADWRAG